MNSKQLYTLTGTKTYVFKHTKIAENTNALYTQLYDVLRITVPDYISSKNILADIVYPMYYFLAIFKFNLKKVKQINLFILNREASQMLFKTNENGNMTRTSPHKYKILIRNTRGCIEAILHELMHVIDEEDDHPLLHLHRRAFEYNLRYFELRAFTLSKIAHSKLLLRRSAQNVKCVNLNDDISYVFDKIELNTKLRIYLNHLKFYEADLLQNYSECPEFTNAGLFDKSYNTAIECIDLIDDCIEYISVN